MHTFRRVMTQHRLEIRLGHPFSTRLSQHVELVRRTEAVVNKVQYLHYIRRELMMVGPHVLVVEQEALRFHYAVHQREHVINSFKVVDRRLNENHIEGPGRKVFFEHVARPHLKAPFGGRASYALHRSRTSIA